MDYTRDGFKLTVIPGKEIHALYIQSNKIDDCISFLLKNPDIRYIILNSETGYRTRNINFLDKIKNNIIGIEIGCEINDYSPLNNLRKLEYLVITQTAKGIDFSFFSQLKECNIIWNENIKNIEESINLTTLSISNYPFPNFLLLSKLKKLKSIDFDNSLIENLSGIENYKSLKEITLFNCKKLKSIIHLEYVSDSLNYLSITKSKELHSYDSISTLNRLNVLGLINCGNTQNADFLVNLKSLQYGTIDIDILDGNVEGLLNLPIMFKNYKHFNHKNIWKIKMDTEGKYILVKNTKK